MRRIGRVMALGLASLTVAALVWLLSGFVVAGWFSGEPFFDWDGEYTFNCYLDRTLPADAFWVTFFEGGREALIRFRDREATLTFQRGSVAGDVYRGERITLTLDPEAYVTGYLDRSIGPCQAP